MIKANKVWKKMAAMLVGGGMVIAGLGMVGTAEAALPATCGTCHNMPGKGTTPKDLCSPTFDAGKRQMMSSMGGISVAQIETEIAAVCGSTTTTTAPGSTTTTTTPSAISGEAATKMYCGICHGLRIGSTQVTADVTAPGIKPGGTKHMSSNHDKEWFYDKIQKMRGRGCPVPDSATVKAMAKWMSTVN